MGSNSPPFELRAHSHSSEDAVISAKVIRYSEPSDSGPVLSTRSVPTKSPVSWNTDPWLSHQVCAQQPRRESHAEMLLPFNSSGGSAENASSTARPPWISRITLRPPPPSHVS